MKRKRVTQNATNGAKAAPIKTTFLELIQELATLTRDDNHLMAVVKNIFSLYNVKFTRTLTPVKLVATVRPVRTKANRRPSWA